METYEYKVKDFDVTLDGDNDNIRDYLNEKGASGYKLVAGIYCDGLIKLFMEKTIVNVTKIDKHKSFFENSIIKER